MRPSQKESTMPPLQHGLLFMLGISLLILSSSFFRASMQASANMSSNMRPTPLNLSLVHKWPQASPKRPITLVGLMGCVRVTWPPSPRSLASGWQVCLTALRLAPSGPAKLYVVVWPSSPKGAMTSILWTSGSCLSLANVTDCL